VKRLVSVLLIVVGVSLALAAAYKVTDPFAGARQSTAQQDLGRSWRQPAVSPPAAVGTPGCTPATRGVPVGRVFALIQIPAFGPNWKFTVIQGTGLPQLATGPGHIPGTAYPGQVGNTGIAAHDVTAGNPFLHLASLRPGDKVIITTQDCVTTYRVTRPSYRVLYTDVAVLKPAGNARTITLITCWPVYVLYFVPHRTIVSGTEISSVRRTA